MPSEWRNSECRVSVNESKCSSKWNPERGCKGEGRKVSPELTIAEKSNTGREGTVHWAEECQWEKEGVHNKTMTDFDSTECLLQHNMTAECNGPQREKRVTKAAGSKNTDYREMGG